MPRSTLHQRSGRHNPLSLLLTSLAFHAKTLFLFTKSDFKTVLIPVTATAMALAPERSMCRIPHILLWLWLLLLQFGAANQSSPGSVAEDSANKPWRPIPASRITLNQTRILRWASTIPCILLAKHYKVLTPTITETIAFLAYNELGLHDHWFSKNVLNAIGYAEFQHGAALIALTNPSRCLSNNALKAIILSSLLILTTIQSQDFKDEEGDRASGRKTVAILFPVAGRISLFLLLLVWAAALPAIWHVPSPIALSFFALGSYVAGRFLLMRSAQADRNSFMLYNVWLLFAFLLPGLHTPASVLLPLQFSDVASNITMAAAREVTLHGILALKSC